MAFGLSQITCPLACEGFALQSLKKTPRPWQIAEAKGEYGEVVARRAYGGDDNILEIEAVYLLKSGNGPATATLGNGTNLESVQIATSNSDWPKYTVKWRAGLPNVTGLAFTVSLPTVQAKRCAQAMGISVGNGARLNSSTYTASVEFGEAPGEQGEMVASAWTNGKAEVTAEAVASVSDPVFTAADGWDMEENGSGISETNTAYGTSSAKASKALAANE